MYKHIRYVSLKQIHTSEKKVFFKKGKTWLDINKTERNEGGVVERSGVYIKQGLLLDIIVSLVCVCIMYI